LIGNIEFEYPRKTIDNTKVEIPINKEDKLKFVLDLIEGEKPVTSENDIYPLKMITNKKLIPKDINDTYTLTTRSNRLEQLDYLLNNPCSSYSLQRERARLRTRIQPFFDCCEDSEHAQFLTSLITFDKNTSYCKLNEDKLKRLICDNVHAKDKFNNNYKFQQLYKCVENKLHFIPIIQSQTDFKLGDCSYLDTCHKMSSCRYIHYGQLMPLKMNNQIKNDNSSNDTGFDKELFEVNENIRIWDFTRGESVCTYLKPELPAQWINCDLMKIDFDVFGNDFGVVIADPSWTIHMNLNYSSLKDEELLGLRMDKLQREGLFLLWVTGRTIETGREFLNKWGYNVINQITWIKTSQLIRTISTGRTGHWLNHSKEHLLVGIKGDVKWLNKGIDAQILISSTRETSRKPDEIYGIIDRLVGQGVKKLEIFGRQHNTRSGWLTVGNQLDGVHLVETALLERYQEWKRQTF
jgi:N6-adenosine-specific RNA methylase IME4